MFDHRGNALYRVKGAEQLFGDGRVRSRLADGCFEREQATAEHHQVLVAFGEVVVEEAIEEVRHSNRPTSAANVCGTNGLVRYVVAPACSAAPRLASSPRVVSTMIGTVRYF